MRRAICLLGLLCQSAGAAIVDRDGWITDTATRLDWLDPIATVGRSFDQVSAALGAGGDLEGWRYARLGELEGLFRAYAGSPDPATGKFLLQGDEAGRLISMWGGSVIPSFPTQAIYGLLGDVVPQAPYDRHHLGVVYDGDERSGQTDFAQTTFQARTASDVGPFGSFLVRESRAIPEPATATLVLGALLGLALAARAARAHGRRVGRGRG